ncbi:MAG: diadenylate cyclase CdaA [Eubacteriales bacterium]|nr:diadenylate cyclase CdaA [Eubacteriales bacterium]
MYFDFHYILNQLGSVGIADIFDILIVAFVFYYLFKFVRERRAGKLALGVILILIMLFISNLVDMRATHFILKAVVNVGLIALLIVFQPELRSMLEKMGGESLKGFKSKLDKSTAAQYKAVIGEICYAAENFSSGRTGALIVIEGSTKLGDVIKTGTIIDGQISSFLLGNIFFNKAPLHDGAVVIRGLRILAAGCFLPLSTNPDIVRDLGTRHRAGIGMSENSDATVIIVSEETGIISVAIDGELKRGFNRSELEQFLTTLLIREQEHRGVKDRLFGKRGGDGEDGFDE